jgi:hypothetical protein
MFLHMSCQIVAISEAFAADNADKWFFVLKGRRLGIYTSSAGVAYVVEMAKFYVS